MDKRMICWCGKTHYNVVKEVIKHDFGFKLIKRPRIKTSKLSKLAGAGKKGVKVPNDMSVNGI